MHSVFYPFSTSKNGSDTPLSSWQTVKPDAATNSRDELYDRRPICQLRCLPGGTPFLEVLHLNFFRVIPCLSVAKMYFLAVAAQPRYAFVIRILNLMAYTSPEPESQK